MRHRLAGPLLLLALALSAVGCGDDAGGTPTEAAATTTVRSVTTAARTVTTTAPDTTVTVPATTTGAASPTDAATAPATAGAAAAATPASSRAAYIARADRFCRSTNADTRRLNARANAAIRSADNDRDRLKALAPILEEGVRAQRSQVARFLAITPPAADRATIERYWSAISRQARLVAQLASAAAEGDVAAYNRIADRSSALREQARGLARAFGFKECGSGKSDAA